MANPFIFTTPRQSLPPPQCRETTLSDTPLLVTTTTVRRALPSYESALYLYSQYLPPQPTNVGFASNHDSDAHSPITNARGGGSLSFTLGDISAQPSSTNPFLGFHSTSNGSPPSHVSTTTCLDRYGGKPLSCDALYTAVSTSTSQTHQVSPPHAITVTIPIGPNLVNGEATFDTVKHGHDDSSYQSSPEGIGADEQETTFQAG